MKITTTARHCELDDVFRQHAQQRLEKLGRFAPDLDEVHLIVTGEKFRHEAEIKLRLDGRELVSRDLADQARIAFDQAADHMEEQVRRAKERRITGRRGSRARAETIAVRRRDAGAVTPDDESGGTED